MIFGVSWILKNQIVAQYLFHMPQWNSIYQEFFKHIRKMIRVGFDFYYDYQTSQLWKFL